MLEGTYNEKLDSRTEMSDDHIVQQKTSSNNSNNDRDKVCNKNNHIDENSNFIYNWCSNSVKILLYRNGSIHSMILEQYDERSTWIDNAPSNLINSTIIPTNDNFFTNEGNE